MPCGGPLLAPTIMTMVALAVAAHALDGAAMVHQQYFSDAACTQPIADGQSFPSNTCQAHPTDKTSNIKYVCEGEGATSAKDGNDYGCFNINTFAIAGCKGSITNTQWYYCDFGCHPYYECQATHVDAWSDCGNYRCSPCMTKTVLPINASCVSSIGTTQVVGYFTCPSTVKRYLLKAALDCATTSVADKRAVGISAVRSGECYYDEEAQAYATLRCNA